MKESQQQNRRFEQEIDSLNFRNQQLTKRVTVLQEEAEQQQLNSKKKQKKGQQVENRGGHGIEESVLENELHSKIEENASLHQRIYDLEEEQRRGWFMYLCFTVPSIVIVKDIVIAKESRHRKRLPSSLKNVVIAAECGHRR